MIRTILKWLGNILTILLIIIIGMASFSMFQAKRNPGYITSIMGYKPMSVLTGSMRPMLEPGDMIVAKDVKLQDIEVGDVITYRMDHKTLVTHRVAEIIQEDGKHMFKTKGDANNVEDQNLISFDQVIGKFVFNIPKGGYVSNFARSGKGFLLLVVFPAILLIVSELKSLWSEIVKDEKKTAEPEDHMEI
jgi:signal peptidase